MLALVALVAPYRVWFGVVGRSLCRACPDCRDRSTWFFFLVNAAIRLQRWLGVGVGVWCWGF